MVKSKLFDGDAAQHALTKRINVGRRMLVRWKSAESWGDINRTLIRH